MISWIQKTFQHHFRAIFTVLLAVIIISFVFVTNASSGFGGAERKVAERKIFGYNLNSPEDQTRLFGDASLSAQLQTGYGADGAELQNYAFQRAAALQMAAELHVPAATQKEVEEHIKGLRIFTGQDGSFDAQRYNLFRDSLKGNPRMSEANVSRIISDDVRVAKVQKLLAGPGYVLTADVQQQLQQAEASWTLGVATVDYASFEPAIPATDAILTKFFEENSFRYDIPPRIVVSYADFPALSLIPTVTVTDAEVRAYYDANPARFPKPAADPKAAPKTDPDVDFAAVRSQVETTLKLERARRIAAKAASDLSFALYEQKLVPGTAAFDALLASQKITLKPLAPFTREAGPAELGGSQDIAEEAFKLSTARAFSDAVTSPTGAVVLFFQELQPVRKPAFTEVRAKVSADYIEGEKQKKFVELGRVIRATIDSRLKAGDSFEKAVAAAASAQFVKITAKTPPAFTLRQPPQDLDYAVYGTLERLEKGKLSDMVVARDHGLIVYAADKKVPAADENSPQFAATRTQLAMGSARIGAGSYLNELVTAELKKSEPPEVK